MAKVPAARRDRYCYSSVGEYNYKTGATRKVGVAGGGGSRMAFLILTHFDLYLWDYFAYE